MKKFKLVSRIAIKSTSMKYGAVLPVLMATIIGFICACKPAVKGASKIKEQTSTGSKYNIYAGFGKVPELAGRFSLAVYKGTSRIEDTFSLETYIKAGTIDVTKVSANNELKIGDLLFKGSINVGKDSDGREAANAQVVDETCQVNDLKLIFDIQSGDANRPNTPQFPTINCVAKNSQNKTLTPAQICSQNGGTELNGSCACSGRPELTNQDVNVLFPAANSSQSVIADFEQELKTKCIGPSAEQICQNYGGTVLNGSCSCTGKLESNPDVNVLFPKPDAGSEAMTEFENELRNSCVEVGGGASPDPAPIQSR